VTFQSALDAMRDAKAKKRPVPADAAAELRQEEPVA